MVARVISGWVSGESARGHDSLVKVIVIVSRLRREIDE